MDARSRAEKLTDLLRGHFNFGGIISRKFCCYWSAELVKEQVVQAARSLLDSEVSLSLYDKVRSELRALSVVLLIAQPFFFFF